MIDPQIGGRVALVTGANHGIGAAIAKSLASQGAKVFINYLRLQPQSDPATPAAYAANLARDPEAVLNSIRGTGGVAEAWEADLAEPATIPVLFDRIEAAFGPVDILINNADAWYADSFLPGRANSDGRSAGLRVEPRSHDDHFAVNSRAVALLIAEFARRHIERSADWGRIASITSAGRDGFPGEVSYGASKAALESYTFSAADELATHGITANVVEPSGTDTGWISAELAEQIKEGSPFGHVGQPDEVVEAMLFFVSHQARYITGQRLHLQ